MSNSFAIYKKQPFTKGLKSPHFTHVLFLHQKVNSGQVVTDVLSDDLRLHLVDPSIDVITALFIEHVTVGVKELLTLAAGGILEFRPLALDLIKTWLDLFSESGFLLDKIFSLLQR